MEIQIDYRNNFITTSDGTFQEMYESLSPMRRARVEECQNPQRKTETLVSGYLLEQRLRQIGVNEPFVYGKSQRGKPFLLGEGGERLPGIDFSISHTKEMSACGVLQYEQASPVGKSTHPAIGIDVEKLGRYRQNVVERFFTPEEQAFFKEVLVPQNAPQNPPDNAQENIPDKMQQMFTLLWTGKEAIAKCLDMPLPEVCSGVNLLPLCQSALCQESLCQNPLHESTELLIWQPIAERDFYLRAEPVQISYRQVKQHIIACAITH
jgi:phosphopantetheinyl transferase